MGRPTQFKLALAPLPLQGLVVDRRISGRFSLDGLQGRVDDVQLQLRILSMNSPDPEPCSSFHGRAPAGTIPSDGADWLTPQERHHLVGKFLLQFSRNLIHNNLPK